MFHFIKNESGDCTGSKQQCSTMWRDVIIILMENFLSQRQQFYSRVNVIKFRGCPPFVRRRVIDELICRHICKMSWSILRKNEYRKHLTLDVAKRIYWFDSTDVLTRSKRNEINTSEWMFSNKTSSATFTDVCHVSYSFSALGINSWLFRVPITIIICL